MNIKKIIITGTLLVSMVAFSQKDELKKLKKIYDKDATTASDIADFKANLSKLEPLSTDEGDKVYFNFYKAIVPQIELASLGTAPNAMQLQKLFTQDAITEMTKAYTATLEYEKKSGKKVLTDDINKDIEVIKPMLLTAAVKYGDVKKYDEASQVLYSIYMLDKKDQEKLYYAANYSVTATNYDDALKYYLELKSLNYSGEGTQYYASNKSSKQEEYFTTKEQRDSYVKIGTHEKPRDEKIASKRGEIYKNIALIYVAKGKNDEAKQAYTDARKANPDDNSLLLNEANFYLTLNDFDTYTRLVNEALAKEPNNVELVFNLGVISANSNKLDKAEEYYKKAISIDPNYFNAYLNLSELKMRGDQKYVDEINKLGTSDKELKRYEVVKAERNKNFLSILPFLEKAHQLDPTNEPAKKTLLSLYKALEMNDKAKELKAKM